MALLASAFCQMSMAKEPKPISLAGQWRFQPDPADVGVSQRWFERALPGRIKLPGGLTEQGVGGPVTVDTKWIGSSFSAACSSPAPTTSRTRVVGSTCSFMN
jgi:hypothetical protein